MKIGLKLFLILLFVGLTSHTFAMKRRREGDKKPTANAKRQCKNGENYLSPKDTIAFTVKCNECECKKRKREGDKKPTTKRQCKNSNQNQNYLLCLPKEIIKTILTMDLSAQDLACVCMTCTKLNTFVEPIKLTKGWEAARWNFFELACFIERRGKDLKNYNLQHIFYACFQAALEKLKDDKWLVRYEALYLVLKALVEQGQYCTEVLQVAIAKFNDKNLCVRAAALNILQALVKQGQYYSKAFQEALAKLDDEFCDIREAALGVLKALVEQGYALAYNPALKEALAKLNDANWRVRVAALMILKALVEQGYESAYPKSLQAALDMLNDEDENVRKAALFVLQALVEQGQYYPEALQAALAKLNDANWRVRVAALRVLCALVEQGYALACNPALKAALAKLNDKNREVRRATLYVLKALVKQGQYFAEALQAALDMLNDEDCLVRYEARKLKSLVEEKMEKQNYKSMRSFYVRTKL